MKKRSMVAQLWKRLFRTVIPVTSSAKMHSLWIDEFVARTSWNTTLSKVKLRPVITAPFSSVTLPMRPFLKVTFEASWFSNVAFMAPPPSTSTPSKVTLSA